MVLLGEPRGKLGDFELAGGEEGVDEHAAVSSARQSVKVTALTNAGNLKRFIRFIRLICSFTLSIFRSPQLMSRPLVASLQFPYLYPLK